MEGVSQEINWGAGISVLFLPLSRDPGTPEPAPTLPPGTGTELPSPEPGLSRGKEAADRRSLSSLTVPRSHRCQPIWGTGSSGDQPAMGEAICAPVATGDLDSTLGTLQCPDGDPRASPPAGLGGACIDKAAFGCQRPGGRACISSAASRRGLEVSLAAPSLVTMYILFLVMTQCGRCFLSALPLVPSVHPHSCCPGHPHHPFPVSQSVCTAHRSQRELSDTQFNHISPWFRILLRIFAK